MIRVMVDADLILEALLNRKLPEVEMQSVLDGVSPNRQRMEMHVTDLGLQKIKLMAVRLQDRQAADMAIEWVRHRVKTFAVGKAMLQAACLSPLRDFESAVELASASFLHLDAIVTHKPDDFGAKVQSFPVWSPEKLRERLFLESLLSPHQYNSLVRDLLKLQCDRQGSCQSVDNVRETEAIDFLTQAIDEELNALLVRRLEVDTFAVRRAIDLGISHFVAGDLSSALESFKLAAQSDPFNCRYLLGIARTNKKIGKYVPALLFAIAALSNAESGVERSLAYSLVGGIYYDLFSYFKQIDYGEEALNFYTKAKAEYPLDVLPVWNTISTCLAIFNNCDFAVIERKEDYLNRAKNYLPVLQHLAVQTNSNWAKYKHKIIEDAKSILRELPGCEQHLISVMQEWN